LQYQAIFGSHFLSRRVFQVLYEDRTELKIAFAYGQQYGRFPRPAAFTRENKLFGRRKGAVLIDVDKDHRILIALFDQKSRERILFGPRVEQSCGGKVRFGIKVACLGQPFAPVKLKDHPLEVLDVGNERRIELSFVFVREYGECQKRENERKSERSEFHNGKAESCFRISAVKRAERRLARFYAYCGK
jgi:hypothetical protein